MLALFFSEDELSAQVANVPPPLRLHWEEQGISGRAYQKDGNPSLYRKKVFFRLLLPSPLLCFCWCSRYAILMLFRLPARLGVVEGLPWCVELVG